MRAGAYRWTDTLLIAALSLDLVDTSIDRFTNAALVIRLCRRLLLGCAVILGCQMVVMTGGVAERGLTCA